MPQTAWTKPRTIRWSEQLKTNRPRAAMVGTEHLRWTPPLPWQKRNVGRTTSAVKYYSRVHRIQATGTFLRWIAWNSGNSFTGMRRVIKQTQTLRHHPPASPRSPSSHHSPPMDTLGSQGEVQAWRGTWRGGREGSSEGELDYPRYSFVYFADMPVTSRRNGRDASQAVPTPEHSTCSQIYMCCLVICI